MRCTPKWTQSSTSRKRRQNRCRPSRRSSQPSHPAPNASTSAGSEFKRLAQKRRPRACAFHPPSATLPMHRWCFSIGNVAKRVWDEDAPSLKQPPCPRLPARCTAGALNRLCFADLPVMLSFQFAQSVKAPRAKPARYAEFTGRSGTALKMLASRAGSARQACSRGSSSALPKISPIRAP